MSDPLSSLYEQMNLPVPEEIPGGSGGHLEVEVDFYQPQQRKATKAPEETQAALLAVFPAKSAKWKLETAETLPAPVAESPPKSPHGNRVPIERKAWNGTQSFTRLVIRPSTSIAAGLAADDAPVERIISSSAADAPPLYGKKRGRGAEYMPNRFHGIINNMWENTPAMWFEGWGKSGLRIVILLTCTAVGLLLWKFAEEVMRFQKSAHVALASAGMKVAPDAERQAVIRRSFDAFLAAGDAAGKLPWVLEPARVESRLKDFYGERHQKDPVPVSYEVSLPQRIGNEWWFTLQCLEKNGIRTNVLMKETPEGGRLDWENFVAYGSMAWEEFQAQKPKLPQSMRVQMRPSKEYGGKYTADAHFAYDISHRDSPQILHGYAIKASRTGQRLAAMTLAEDWQPANLYLLWEADAGAPGSILIADLIGNNWLGSLNNTQTVGVPAAEP